VVEIANQVLVLDLDDTLYLERDFALSGFAAVGRHLEDSHGVSGYAAHCARLLDEGHRGTVFDEALAAMGLPTIEVAPLVALYRGHLPEIALADDAVRLLARLGGRASAIITDGPAQTQGNKVSALGLYERIGKVVLTGLLPEGCGKPHAMAYELVEQWSGRPAVDHVYVADNAAKDFVTPRARGWTTVQILRERRIHPCTAPTPDHAAHHVVASLDELALS
jgi:putative hydrolase of the HAD superfamily